LQIEALGEDELILPKKRGGKFAKVNHNPEDLCATEKGT